MTKQEKKELAEKTLAELLKNQGGEEGHWQADYALLQLITALLDGDDRIEKAFNDIPSMWYA